MKAKRLTAEHLPFTIYLRKIKVIEPRRIEMLVDRRKGDFWSDHSWLDRKSR